MHSCGERRDVSTRWGDEGVQEQSPDNEEQEE